MTRSPGLCSGTDAKGLSPQMKVDNSSTKYQWCFLGANVFGGTQSKTPPGKVA
jgi:hypothetical protein